MGSSQRKPEGWWSRRHRTRDAQDAARAAYENRRAGRPKQTYVQDGAEFVWVKEAQ